MNWPQPLTATLSSGPQHVGRHRLYRLSQMPFGSLEAPSITQGREFKTGRVEEVLKLLLRYCVTCETV